MQQDLDIAGVEQFVVLEQRLQLEEAKLLHALRGRDVEALADDFNANLQGILNLSLVDHRAAILVSVGLLLRVGRCGLRGVAVGTFQIVLVCQED